MRMRGTGDCINQSNWALTRRPLGNRSNFDMNFKPDRQSDCLGSSLFFCTTLNTNPITYCPLSITFCAASLQRREERRQDEHQCKSIINSESRVKSEVSLAQPVIKRQTNGLIIKGLQEVFSNPSQLYCNNVY